MVSGIVLSDAQTQVLATCLDAESKKNIGTATSVVWGCAEDRYYELLLANLNPKSKLFPPDFTHPLPNPNEDYEYVMIVPGAEWKPQDAGGAESLDDIAQKEIRSWIIQETEGNIPGKYLPWLTINDELIIAGGL